MGHFLQRCQPFTRDDLSFGHDEPRISLTNRRKWTIPSPSSQGDRHASGSLAANLSSDSWKICENLYVYIYIYEYVYIYTYTCEYIYMYMYVYIYMYMYIYMYLWICVHILSLSLSEHNQAICFIEVQPSTIGIQQDWSQRTSR